MNQLKQYLDDGQCRGVARSAGGETVVFRRRGVIDLFELSTARLDFLCGASVADKVVGRGAALLFVRGGVGRLHARIISSGALDVLRRGGVEVSFDAEVPNIINRTGTDICPVERLTACTESPDEAYLLIKNFIENQKQKL